MTSLVLNAARQVYNMGATQVLQSAFTQANFSVFIKDPFVGMTGYNGPLAAMNSSWFTVSHIIGAIFTKLLGRGNTISSANELITYHYPIKAALTGSILADVTGYRKLFYVSVLLGYVSNFIAEKKNKKAPLADLPVIRALADIICNPQWEAATKIVNVAAGAIFLCNRQLNLFGAFLLVREATA